MGSFGEGLAEGKLDFLRVVEVFVEGPEQEVVVFAFAGLFVGNSFHSNYNAELIKTILFKNCF